MRHRARSFYRALFRAWMRFAHALGVVNTAILLSIVYWIGISFMRLVDLIRREHPLAAPAGDSFWRPKPAPDPSLEPRRRLRFQF